MLFTYRSYGINIKFSSEPRGVFSYDWTAKCEFANESLPSVGFQATSMLEELCTLDVLPHRKLTHSLKPPCSMRNTLNTATPRDLMAGFNSRFQKYYSLKKNTTAYHSFLRPRREYAPCSVPKSTQDPRARCIPCSYWQPCSVRIDRLNDVLFCGLNCAYGPRNTDHVKRLHQIPKRSNIKTKQTNRTTFNGRKESQYHWRSGRSDQRDNRNSAEHWRMRDQIVFIFIYGYCFTIAHRTWLYLALDTTTVCVPRLINNWGPGTWGIDKYFCLSRVPTI